MSNSVCLASPFHDPEGRLLELLQENGEKLLSLYHGNAVVNVSPKTSHEIIALLKTQGFSVFKQKSSTGLISDNYLSAIRIAVRTDSTFIHLVDFDRALHWAKRFPRELRDVVKILPTYQGFVSLVRTNRSFQSHPQVQRSTESIVNAIASEVSSIEIDIMSGSFGFQKKLAVKIVQEAKRKDYGIYAEFLTIALKHKFLISTIEVEGLEWETPDQYQDIISKEGYSAWLHAFESLPEWKKRITLLEDSADVLIPE